MVQPTRDPIGFHRHNCGECQRRKQKCNRQWPCETCKKRRVVDKCRFKGVVAPGQKPAQVAGKKRSKSDQGGDDKAGEGDASQSDGERDCNGTGLEALGYMDGPILESLGFDVKDTGKSVREEDYVTPDQSALMLKALDALNVRSHVDSLVQLFFDNVNFHYYMLFPAKFLGEYEAWWKTRESKGPLSIQWTSLLLTICACTVQHLEINQKPQIEAAWGESAEDLTQSLLALGTELAASVPDGHFHMLDVQRLMHAIYWYKSEARFAEAWHMISHALRQAQELGVPKDASSDHLSEFECEVRRRAWCILVTWDWQFASGLGRPTLIEHNTSVEVPLPTFTLEDFEVSPLLYMTLQVEIIAVLGKTFHYPARVHGHDRVGSYIQILEDWMQNFPAVYRTEDPDHSYDKEYPWIVSHRFYIHTMAYLMILNPIRKYMGHTYLDSSDAAALHIREVGVNYALKNLKTTSAWTQHISHKDGRFHFIIFSLFDTASVLSAAIVKDHNYNLPQRSKVLAGIDEAVDLLSSLNDVSISAAASYALLSNIVKRVPGSKYFARRKRQKTASLVNPAPNPAQVSNGTPLPTNGSAAKHDSNPPRNGSETTLSNYTSGTANGGRSGSGSGSSSATTGTRSPSLDVHTPNTEPQAVVAYEQPVIPPSYAANEIPYDGYNMPDPGFMSELKPSFPPLDLDPVPSAHPMIQAPQGLTNAYAAPPLAGSMPEQDFNNTPPITGEELGSFNSLWDWGALNLPFINAVKVVLEPPEMGPEH